jgi:hypothetical protein
LSEAALAMGVASFSERARRTPQKTREIAG